MRCRAWRLSVALAAATVASLAQPDLTAQARHLRANGVDLTYAEEGRGAPVVFVHGAACDLRYWEPQRTEFAKRYRYIAYSYRYHGTDPWPDNGSHYSGETHAADLAAFISALGAGPVHLVGLSYGGTLAATVAVEHPAQVRTLTLAEPGIFSLLAETPEGKPLLEEWNKAAEPMVAAIKAGDTLGATRHLNALVTGTPPEEFDKRPESFRRMLLDNARTLPLLLAAPPPNVTCEMMRGIKAATLVVRGERTTRIFSKINDEVGRCIPGSRLIVIPGASHPMSYENPAAFNRAVLGFLEQSPSKPAR